MRSLILLCAALCCSLFVPSALAGPPTSDRVPIGTVLAMIPAESACPGASAGVRITDVGGNLTFTTFDSGRMLTTGRGELEITNIATGKSVVITTQGIVSVVQHDSGFEVRAIGTPLWVFYPGDAGPGDATIGRMYLFTGLTWAEQDASQTNISFGSIGRAQDVCAMIA